MILIHDLFSLLENIRIKQKFSNLEIILFWCFSCYKRFSFELLLAIVEEVKVSSALDLLEPDCLQDDHLYTAAQVQLDHLHRGHVSGDVLRDEEDLMGLQGVPEVKAVQGAPGVQGVQGVPGVQGIQGVQEERRAGGNSSEFCSALHSEDR